MGSESDHQLRKTIVSRRRFGRGGFTLIEMLVILGIVVILLSIFIPYLLSVRESSRRIRCANNLYQIRDGLNNYALLNHRELPRVRYDAVNDPNGYTAFTGPDSDNPFAENSAVLPNDVTASLWLLIRDGLVASPGVFVCPSSSDTRDLVTDPSGRLVKPTQRGNFRKPWNLSYSYASPFTSAPEYRMNKDSIKYEFALVADKNPGAAATSQGPDAPPGQMIHANSPNHGGIGQNVLFGSGVVAFVRTPYCGSVLVNVDAAGNGTRTAVGDNIYTARAPRPTTQAAQLPIDVPGVIGHDVGPVRSDDSYLIPTAEDGVVTPTTPPSTLPTTRPSSAPATTTSVTSRPSTLPSTSPTTAP